MYSTKKVEAIACSLPRCVLLALILFLAVPNPLVADDHELYPEVWLVTYGPGETSWERFGHNGLWIRDPDTGLDHIFNYGIFDFRQEAFFSRFLQGKLLYSTGAQPAQREFPAYIDANRSIRAQRLALDDAATRRLIQHLLHDVQPENRDYLYDYYIDNCSTRIRDAIDLALDNQLQTGFSGQPSGQSWRDHTRRFTNDAFWLYLGLEVPLGDTIDHEIDQWEGFFIPSILADAIADVQIAGPDGPGPLVTEDVMLFESDVAPVPETPQPVWLRYLLASLGVLAIAWLTCRFVPRITSFGLSKLWLVLAGLAGCALTFFWFGTDHTAASRNFNLLLLNPLLLVLFLLKQPRLAGWLLIVLGALATVIAAIPGGQYFTDTLALLLPINVVAAVVLLRQETRGQSHGL